MSASNSLSLRLAVLTALQLCDEPLAVDAVTDEAILHGEPFELRSMTRNLPDDIVAVDVTVAYNSDDLGDTTEQWAYIRGDEALVLTAEMPAEGSQMDIRLVVASDAMPVSALDQFVSQMAADEEIKVSREIRIHLTQSRRRLAERLGQLQAA